MPRLPALRHSRSNNSSARAGFRHDEICGSSRRDGGPPVIANGSELEAAAGHGEQPDFVATKFVRITSL
jgi:hypothetical protein